MKHKPYVFEPQRRKLSTKEKLKILGMFLAIVWAVSITCCVCDLYFKLGCLLKFVAQTLTEIEHKVKGIGQILVYILNNSV